MPAWIAAVLVVFGLVGLALTYRAMHKRQATIERLGLRYGVKRWPDESDEHFIERIRDRICAKGGRRW